MLQMVSARLDDVSMQTCAAIKALEALRDDFDVMALGAGEDDPGSMAAMANGSNASARLGKDIHVENLAKAHGDNASDCEQEKHIRCEAGDARGGTPECTRAWCVQWW